ncbi:MAG: TIR domain-containing protein [Luteimonas sp.]
MADIFVSYSRLDQPRVAPLVAALEAQGWSVWWDPEITPGEEFDSLISRELDDARSLIVVWTPQSVESRWVRGEARDAADRGVLVPVRFDNARLQIDFRALHATDLDGWKEDRKHPAFLSLCKALESKLGVGTHASPEAQKDGRIGICVLPFANMSNVADNEYFSDGIAGEILNLLAKLPQLKVASRTSSFNYKGREVNIPAVARELGVSVVLEGSVRRAADHVRITAQLIDAESDSHLWSETYDREMKDVFAIQDDIAQSIVKALQVTLTPGAPCSTSPPPIPKPTTSTCAVAVTCIRCRGATTSTRSGCSSRRFASMACTHWPTPAWPMPTPTCTATPMRAPRTSSAPTAPARRRWCSIRSRPRPTPRAAWP